MIKSVCKNDGSLLDRLLGANILIRSATVYNVGRLTEIDEDFLLLEDASWVADTGRWTEAHESGSFSELEPHRPGSVFVARGGIVDITPWGHELPREVV